MNFPTLETLDTKSKIFYQLAQISRLNNQESLVPIKPQDYIGNTIIWAYIVASNTGLTDNEIERAIRIGTVLGNSDFKTQGK